MVRGRKGLSIGVVAVMAGLATSCASGSGASRTPSSSTPSTPSTSAQAEHAVAARGLAPGRHVVSFAVGGLRRTAVVVVPAATRRPAPLVLVFHGHGGSGAKIDERLEIERLWPAAIVAYPDGLVGHRGVTDPQGVRTGWQTRQGEQGDRDLALYDTMLATLGHQLPVDADRIYLVGHSNGSAFVSLLLNQRGAGIAATANLSAQPPARLLATDPARSMFMAMGTGDAVVPYARQRMSIPIAERKLGIAPAAAPVVGTLHSEHGRGGLELATYVYAGGHAPPPGVAQLVVDFFRRHTLSGG